MAMKGTKVQTLSVTIDTQSIYSVTHFSELVNVLRMCIHYALYMRCISLYCV